MVFLFQVVGATRWMTAQNKPVKFAGTYNEANDPMRGYIRRLNLKIGDVVVINDVVVGKITAISIDGKKPATITVSYGTVPDEKKPDKIAIASCTYASIRTPEQLKNLKKEEIVGVTDIFKLVPGKTFLSAEDTYQGTFIGLYMGYDPSKNTLNMKNYDLALSNVRAIDKLGESTSQEDSFAPKSKKQFSGYWDSAYYPDTRNMVYVHRKDAVINSDGTITFKWNENDEKPITVPKKTLTQNPSESQEWIDAMMILNRDIIEVDKKTGREQKTRTETLRGFEIGAEESLFTLVGALARIQEDPNMTQAVVNDIMNYVPLKYFQGPGEEKITDKIELAKTLTPDQLRSILMYYTFAL